MWGIPRAPLALGLAGTLPFIAGALFSHYPGLLATLSGMPIFAARLFGAGLLSAYGIVIFAFMSGVLWGFATKAPTEMSARYYVLSVIPAILVFLYAIYGFATPLVGFGQPSLLPLIVGFLCLLIWDYLFWNAGLTPEWWMKLRSLITMVVVISLLLGSRGQ